MPKRSYDQISSSVLSFLKQSTTTTTSITDLPVDVLCLVLKRLPLSEVLRNQSLVCKLFYNAHLQHCRSSVKQLTLFGHYMLKRNRLVEVEQQEEVVRKQMLFEYARETNSSSSSTPTINPSASHLKLVVGLEESAYSAIGTKFKSVTHLELFQLPLERHYKPITAMINAWGKGDGGGEEKKKEKKKKKKKKVTAGGGDEQISATANQLTELKIFHSKEMYRPDGTHTKRGNNSCCLAYLLAEALTPTKAPALRRLVISPGNHLVASKHGGNYNTYNGPLLSKIHLPQVTAVNALDIDVIGLLEASWSDYYGRPITEPRRPRELTIKTTRTIERGFFLWSTESVGRNYQKQHQIYYQRYLFGRLTGLTVSFSFGEGEFLKSMPEPGLAVNLRCLSLQDVQWPLSKLVQQLVVPMTTTATTTPTTPTTITNVTINDRLKELRVAWEFHDYQNSPIEALTSAARFPALTTLHLVKSTLLHRADEMSALSALFPNLAHLRLDDHHSAANLRTIKAPNYIGQRHCPQCVQHVWDAFLERNPGAQTEGDNLLMEETGDVQLLPSSTAPVCKAALVRRAVAAWPKLAIITLQIDDFFRVTDYDTVSRLQYLYRSENLLLRDPATGEPLQEEDLKWTVEEVLY